MPSNPRTVLTVVKIAPMAAATIAVTGVFMSADSTPQPPAARKNRLGQEKSPYLLQHADNPVDWYPWGDEAFERARREDRPVLLSIGYATCHWCHVMEHESFLDAEVSALMNRAFVNIKVDREERPDVDQVYMTVCQMLTGSGGWPLTILMTPEKEPFFAATYLPKEGRYGRIGMVDLIPRVEEMWRTERSRLLDSTRQIVEHLRLATRRSEGGAIDESILDTAFHQLGARYDAANGGFGDRPKFPSPHNLVFLLRYWHRTGSEQALAMAQRTLERMRLGGIYDHVGFGFHRYSTDEEWRLPHFEKMLYDQAMQTIAYTEAYQATGQERFRRVAREVLSYVLRDMTSSEGGFYSAEDADSEGEEGLFYLWTVDQVHQTLDASDAPFFTDLFGLFPEGNFLDESTQRRTGANIPLLAESHADAARRLGMGRDDFEERLEAIRVRLFEEREKRIHPLKDDKILADWNGLMAAAMAMAGRVFGDENSVRAAARSVDFVLRKMRADDGRLLHRYRDRSVSVDAFLDDYAFLVWAALELYQATFDPKHLEQAVSLQREADARFWDDRQGGYFFTADDAEQLLVRQKEVSDGAIPSGNSVSMGNLVRLARLTGRMEYARRADAVAEAFGGDVARTPAAHAHLLDALQTAIRPSVEVVIAGDPADERTARLIAEVRNRYLPHAVVLVVPDGDAGAAIRRLAPFAESYRSLGGVPAAYICRNHECRLPTSEPGELARMLEEAAAVTTDD